MLARFKFEDKELTIQFNPEETAQDVCNHFVNKTFLNINELNFKFGDKALIPELPLLSQLNLQEETKEIEILASKKELVKEHYAYVDINGVKEKVPIQKGKSIYDSVIKYIKQPFKKFVLLVNGQAINERDRRKTFHQIANRENKRDNAINIIAYEMEENIQEPMANQNKNENESDENNKNKDEIKSQEQENQEKQTNLEEQQPLQDEEEAELLIDKPKFYLRLYVFLLIQLVFVGLFTYLGFHYEIDDYFSNSSKAFWWTIVTISIFALFSSSAILCLSADESCCFCKYFMMIVCIPIITIYFFLLKRHDGIDILEGKYIIYQIIDFGLDYLLLIFSNFIFKRYRGWLNLLLLVAINVLTIYIYAGPLSDNYENLKMSHDAFVGLSVISSVMIAFIIIFNSQILDAESIKKSDNEASCSLFAAINFNYIPFFIVFCLIIIAIIIGLILAVILIIAAIILAIGIIVLAIFLIGLLLGGLA